MKQINLFFFAIALLCQSNTIFAVDDKQIREEARFVADKMAYQFNMDNDQLADVYEINYDFLKAIYPLTDALIAGDEKAITQYYVFLDRRNTDLVWLMNAEMYTAFLSMENLFRPVYVKNGTVQLRIYDAHNKGKFFKGKPKGYSKYNGEHGFSKYPKNSFYQGRYKLIAYGGQPRLLHERNKELLIRASKYDFGK